MSKTYEILLNGQLVDNYTWGCISGIICVVIGMSADFDYVLDEDNPVAVRLDATEEQVRSVVEWINHLYPDIYAGVKAAD